MHPRKWWPNSKKVLPEIDMMDKGKQLDLNMDDWPLMKTFGGVWSASPMVQLPWLKTWF